MPGMRLIGIYKILFVDIFDISKILFVDMFLFMTKSQIWIFHSISLVVVMVATPLSTARKKFCHVNVKHPAFNIIRWIYEWTKI